MSYNFVTNINGCIESAAQLMNGNLNLVYYSHIPVAIISIILGFFVISKNRLLPSARALFVLSMVFSFWIICNMVAWVSSNSILISFFWSLTGIFEYLIFASALYLLYVYESEKDMPFIFKLSIGLLFLPILIFTPTKYFVAGFDYVNCTAIDKLFGGYLYLSLAAITSMMIAVAIRKFLQCEKSKKKQILMIDIGIASFLISFFGTYYVADTYENYSIEVYGVFAMTVFMAFLAYLIVKFKAFNIKLIGAQALVWALVILVGSQFLYMNEMPLSSLIITAVTLVLSAVVGLMIVRGIKKEIAIREKVEGLAKELEHKNERLKELDQQKSQFVSLASHQLRAPLTSIKGYLSMLLEGDYGEVKGEQREMIERVATSANNLVTIVGDFLDVSRIEQGKMVYNWSDFDLKPLVETVFNEQKPVAEKKGIVLNLDIEKAMTFKVHADMNKLKQVFTNLVDNSIKYTPKGEVKLSLSRPSPGILRFEIKDTGIGISAETIPKLFEKFTRAEGANDVNVIGTGLGLFVVKQMINAHEGGKVWVESEGLGKGSRFIVELKAI